jgi:hypothetical protein
MPFHSDTLSWFRSNQSLLLYINYACLTQKQHDGNSKALGLTRLGLELTTNHTRGDHAIRYTVTDAVYTNRGNITK